MEELTGKQRKILEFITSKAKEGSSPTIREIGEKFRISSTGTVRDYLAALEKKGYIERKDKTSRGITLTFQKSTRSIPVVGRIAAGKPILAVEDTEETLEIDSDLLPKTKDIFAVQVKGNSMINIGIYDGDYAFIKKQRVAERGEIVAVLIEDEVTLKRFYPEQNRIRLKPENDNEKPIYINPREQETIILGKLVGTYRRY